MKADISEYSVSVFYLNELFSAAPFHVWRKVYKRG